MATQAKHQPTLPHRKGRETAAQDYTYDLRQGLDARAGLARAIYESKARAPTQEDGYQARRDQHNLPRGENRLGASAELCRDAARYRGAAHPLCFTDEVMEHQFPEGFKPMNIESYDSTTDPTLWIEDFLIHIHMARGDDLHTIKYLP